MTIDLSKIKHVDFKAIQKNNFTGNLDWAVNTTIFFCYWRSKRNYFEFFSTVRLL